MFHNTHFNVTSTLAQGSRLVCVAHFISSDPHALIVSLYDSHLYSFLSIASLIFLFILVFFTFFHDVGQEPCALSRMRTLAPLPRTILSQVRCVLTSGARVPRVVAPPAGSDDSSFSPSQEDPNDGHLEIGNTCVHILEGGLRRVTWNARGLFGSQLSSQTSRERKLNYFSRLTGSNNILFLLRSTLEGMSFSRLFRYWVRDFSFLVRKYQAM